MRLNRTSRAMIEIAEDLRDQVDGFTFASPVTHVYNPLDYAWEAHRQYLRDWARNPVEALMLGMNPGPWGMAQTGVPFGEVAHVREFLGINTKVGKPKVEHPKRPVEGFDCARSEVSGRRLWGFVQSEFGTADAFFSRFFVWNECPLAFLEESGRNRTPDKLPVSERGPLEAVCGTAIRRMVEVLKPRMVIGIGGHARKRLASIFADEIEAGSLECGTVLHPSPASPAANRGWDDQARRQIQELGLLPVSAR